MTGTEAPKRRGRPPGKRAEATAPAPAKPGPPAKKQSRITEEGRQQLRPAMKKRWAAKEGRQGRKEARRQKASIGPVADPRVFLSHSSKDKEFVRELYRRLTRDGVSCFFDSSQAF
jgi:hypothetical protein